MYEKAITRITHTNFIAKYTELYTIPNLDIIKGGDYCNFINVANKIFLSNLSF